MLTKEENRVLTQVGPGTPMGALIRRYWIPALLSLELPEPDCPPVRVKLLGENLVGFRDTGGRVGLLDEFCAHRRASLFLGRNEEGGLRCVYHGWKYDIDGNCVNMPSEPENSRFKDQIHLKSYPTVELGDVIWTYMGPKEKTPPLPRFEWTQVPKGQRIVSKMWEECNWLQALEGGLDSAHVSFLHYGLPPRAGVGDRKNESRMSVPMSKIEVELTDYGFVYAGIRARGEDSTYIRASQYIMPFHKYHAAPSGVRYDGRGEIKDMTMAGHAWVPVDDENTMAFNISYSVGDEPLSGHALGGAGPETTDTTEGFRKRQNKDNNWLIDRQKQKTQSYTGIEGIAIQDHAVQESMGPIVDRSEEHLASIDRAIVAARLMLLRGVKTVQAGGDPPGIGESYYRVRAVERVLPHGIRWQDRLKNEISP